MGLAERGWCGLKSTLQGQAKGERRGVSPTSPASTHCRHIRSERPVASLIYGYSHGMTRRADASTLARISRRILAAASPRAAFILCEHQLLAPGDSRMAAELQVLIRHIRRVAGRRELANRSDRELLAAYALERNEEAFTELVRRHALLVAGVCRRVLAKRTRHRRCLSGHFPGPLRKARTVSWHESAANWLHSVAFHLAIRSRKIALRQQKLDVNPNRSQFQRVQPAPFPRPANCKNCSIRS